MSTEYSLRARLGLIRRLIDLFGSGDLASLLDLFQRFDLSLLPEFVSAVQQLIGAEDWSGPDGRVAAGLKLAKLLATLSETEVDDQLLSAIESILQDVGVLNAFAAQCEASAAGQPAAMSASDQSVYEAAGFDLGQIIGLINLLMEIFRD